MKNSVEEVSKDLLTEAERHVGRHFDADAKRWWDLYGGLADDAQRVFASRMEAVLADLHAFCKPVNRQRVLDIGCGTGPYLAALAPEWDSVVGLDYSPKMLMLADQRFDGSRGKAGLVCASALQLPFKKDSCSAVVAAGLVEYFEEPARVLENFNHVLKPGGIAVVTAPYRWSFARITGLPKTALLWLQPKTKVKIAKFLNRLGWRRDLSSLYLGGSFSFRQIRRLAATSGLQVEKISLACPNVWWLFGIRLFSPGTAVALTRWVSQRRDRWPWSRFGSDLIVVLRKPVSDDVECVI